MGNFIEDFDPTNPDHLAVLKEICGGVKRTGGGDQYDFGWREGSPDEWAAAGLVSADDPDDDDGIYLTGDRVLLTDYAAAANRGVMPAYNWQLTGSCVNGGGQNALTTRLGVEYCRLPQPERFVIPFTLFAYGQSRYDAYRDNTEGDGSSGAAMAAALSKGTVLPSDDPRLPQPSICGPALVYNRDVELRMSAIKNHPPELRRDASAHTLRYREVRNSADGIEQLRRGRPITFAGDWGGQDRPSRVGTPAVLLSEHAQQWNHQQSVLGFWNHPTLGLIFLVLNQWYYPDPAGTLKARWIRSGRGQSIAEILTPGNALSMHGDNSRLEDGTVLPAGSYWIRAKSFDYQCSTGEVRSLYSVKGFGGLVAPTA